MKRKNFVAFVGFLGALCLSFALTSCDGGPKSETDENGLVFTQYHSLMSGPMDAYEVCGYTGSDTHVEIPETFNGKSVLGIGMDAFTNNSTLQSILIPNTVISIEDLAFRGCSSLKTLTVPASVRTSFCICGCSSLTELTLNQLPSSSFSYTDENGNKCVYDDGCKNVDNLKKVTLPTEDFSVFTRLSKYPNAETVVFSNNTDYAVEMLSFGYIRDNFPAVKKLVLPSGVQEIHHIFPTVEEIEGLAVKRIGSNAFSNSNLKSITVPQGVVEIGESAFEGCTQLESVVLPSGLTKIHRKAFSNCTKLENIVFPDGLTKIDQDAFYNCASLQEITVPASVTDMNYKVFENCSSLKKIEFLEGSKFQSPSFEGCTSLKDVIISSTSQGIPVGDFCVTIKKEITNKAFYDKTLPSKIVLPATLTEIPERAFQFCDGLKQLVILDGVKIIHSHAFATASDLETVTLPTGLTEIGEWAFSNCKKLQSIEIPDTVTAVGKAAFYECTALETAKLPVNIQIIPNTCFAKSGLTEIVLPDGVTVVSNSAFNECRKLAKVTLSTQLVTIENYAFFATNLTELTLNDNLETIGEWAFAGCPLTSLTLNDKLKTIGEGTFNGGQFSELFIPASVTTIDERAFSDYLTKPTGGEGLKKVASNAFNYEKLEITTYGNVRYKFIYALGPVSTDVEWIRLKPASVVTEQAFMGCANLTTVYVGKNTTLKDEVFLNCNVFLKVMFESTAPNFSTAWNVMLKDGSMKYYLNNTYTINGVAGTKLGTITENVKITQDGYLYKGTSIYGYVGGETQLTLPTALEGNAVTSVYTNAFIYRMDITSITINAVKNISTSAFAYCTNLTSVTITSDEYDVGDTAFAYCTNLTNLTLGEGLRFIRIGSFMNCTSLKSVTLPSTVQTIQGSAFMGSALNSATFSTGCFAWYVIGGNMQTEILDTLDFSSDTHAANELTSESNIYYVFANKVWLDEQNEQ